MPFFLIRLLRARRWQRYADGYHGPHALRRLTLWAAGLLVLHIAAMMALEGLSLMDAVWLTATTAVTVGYGDLSAKTVEGRLATMGLMYVGAIFVLTKAVNDWFEFKAEKVGRRLRGDWDWAMQDHLLVIGDPAIGNHAPTVAHRAAEYLERLVTQIHAHAEWADTPVQIMTRVFAATGLPARLQDHGIVHHAGTPTSRTALAAVHPEAARAVIILAASETDATADAYTFDTIDRLRRAGCTAPIIAECVDRENESRLASVGATAVVPPMHGYPEMLARAIIAPGAEQIITELFTAEGHECRRVRLPSVWRGAWPDLCARILAARIGTPIGYVGPNGTIHSNPMGPGDVEAQALFVIVHDDQDHDVARIPVLLGLTR